MIDKTFLCPTVPETNSREHWHVKGVRHTLQKALVRQAIGGEVGTITLPVKVRLTRIASRKMDEKDNLRTSLKWICDEIADLLIPGKAPGQADSSPLIQWEYAQEIGSIRKIRIQIDPT